MNPESQILIVDDEQVILESASMILKSLGCKVDCARDMPEATQRLAACRYHIVLADLMLPHTPEFQLADLVLTEQPEALLIVMSGYATVGNTIQSLKRGAFDFLPKPFDWAELSGVISRALHFSRLEPRERSSLTTAQVFFQQPSACPCFIFGIHSWARLRTSGEAELGLHPAVVKTLGSVDQIVLSAAGTFICQGGSFVRITTSDQFSHTIWSPLSGLITATNAEVQAGALLSGSSSAPPWLLRIQPSNLQAELAQLERPSGI